MEGVRARPAYVASASVLHIAYDEYIVEFDPGCEAMIFSTDGVPLQGKVLAADNDAASSHYCLGITGGFDGNRRVEHIVPREAVLRGTYEVVIESSCNGMFGVPMNGNLIEPPDVSLCVGFLKRLTHHFLDEQVLWTRICGPRRPEPRRMYICTPSLAQGG